MQVPTASSKSHVVELTGKRDGSPTTFLNPFTYDERSMPWHDGDSRSVSYDCTASDKGFAMAQTNGIQFRVNQLLAARMTKRSENSNFHERGSKGVEPSKECTANAPRGLPEALRTYRRDIDEMHYNVLLRSINLERVLSGNQAFEKVKKTLVRNQCDKVLVTNLAAGDSSSSQFAPRYLLDLRYISWQLAELASSVNVAVVAWKPLESIDAQARKDLNAWLHAKNFKEWISGRQFCKLMRDQKKIAAGKRITDYDPMKLVEISVLASVKGKPLPSPQNNYPEASFNTVPIIQADSQGLQHPGHSETRVTKGMPLAELKPKHDRRIAEIVKLKNRMIYMAEDKFREGHQRIAQLEQEFEEEKNFIKENLGSHINRGSGGKEMKRTNDEPETPVGGHKRRRRTRAGEISDQIQKAEEVNGAKTERAELQIRLKNDQTVASRTAAVKSGQIPVGASPSTEAVTNRVPIAGDTTNGFATHIVDAVALEPDIVGRVYDTDMPYGHSRIPDVYQQAITDTSIKDAADQVETELKETEALDAYLPIVNDMGKDMPSTASFSNARLHKIRPIAVDFF